MNVKYFRDTDTALCEFSDAAVDEAREISEYVVVDLHKNGNLVSMTIEHAAALAHLPHVRVEDRRKRGVTSPVRRRPFAYTTLVAKAPTGGLA